MSKEKKVVYLGGPIDFAPGLSADRFHQDVDWKGMGLTPYCPRCECRGLSDELAIDQNMLVLREAWLGIFDLRAHTIGTPIEMFLRCWIHQSPAIIIGKEESLFIRETERRFGTFVVPTTRRAIAILMEITSNG